MLNNVKVIIIIIIIILNEPSIDDMEIFVYKRLATERNTKDQMSATIRMISHNPDPICHTCNGQPYHCQMACP